MSTQYMVLNPETGQHTLVDTEQAAYDLAAETAINFYLSHCHNSPISILITDDQNRQTLLNADGTLVYQNAEPTARAILPKKMPVTQI